MGHLLLQVADLFRPGQFPHGEEAPHGETKFPDPDTSYQRKTAAERREADRLLEVCADISWVDVAKKVVGVH